MAFERIKLRIAKRRRAVKVQERQLAGARRRLEKTKRRLARLRAAERDNARFCGSRGVTNRIIEIVDGRASVSSRKRLATDPLSKANPGSDHNCANVCADAVDFRIANAFSLADEISQKLGGPANVQDFQNFTVRFDGDEFRVQLIAGTHGTGPHLHAGVNAL